MIRMTCALRTAKIQNVLQCYIIQTLHFFFKDENNSCNINNFAKHAISNENFTLEQATKAQTGSRVIALIYL